MRNLVSSLIVFFFVFCNSGLRAENIENVNEEIGIVEMLPDKVGTHWVWVSDMVWNAMPDGRATLVNGSKYSDIIFGGSMLEKFKRIPANIPNKTIFFSRPIIVLKTIKIYLFFLFLYPSIIIVV